jgi:hypothetical protein
LQDPQKFPQIFIFGLKICNLATLLGRRAKLGLAAVSLVSFAGQDSLQNDFAENVPAQEVQISRNSGKLT